MKIEQLTIENFRQFKGRKTIRFATAKGRNVTLIHAENGFGKTALLNALLWGFYGFDGLTEDLPKPGCILHESLSGKSRRSEGAYARVLIEFSDGDDHYTLSRSISLDQQRDDPKKSDLSLEVRRVDGGTIPIDSARQAQLRIDYLMPRGISSYLFFNGERIDHLAMDKSAGEITEAIHQMLGLQLLHQTIEDLSSGSVRGALTKEWRANTDDETASLLDRIEELNREIADFHRKAETNKNNQGANKRELEQIYANLEANKEARELQKERKRLEGEITQLEASIREQSGRIARLISEQGFALFAEPLAEKGEEIANRLRKENKLPPKVYVGFVRDLLQGGRCLCGCELKPGSVAYGEVEKWYAVAGDQSLSAAVSLLDKAVGAIRQGATGTRKTLQAAIKDRAALRQRVIKHQERLDEISAKLGSKEDSEVHELEAKREKLLQKQSDLSADERLIERDLQDRHAELDTKKRELQERKQKQEAAAKAQRRLATLDAAVDLLESILKAEREDLRVELGREIRGNFDEVKLKPDHWLELTPEFTLKLLKRTEDGADEIDVAHSTGERQLMSLVFMASLVALARRRAEVATIVQGLNGGEFPLIMDSPFGQLGEDMRGGVAKWVPHLAPQVVLLVTPSQYKGAVAEELNESKRVGRRYLMTYHARTKPEGTRKVVELDGEKHSQYFKSDVEYTDIEELER